MTILIPLWTVFVMYVIYAVHPESRFVEEQPMKIHLLWFVFIPVAAVMLTAGTRWKNAVQHAEPQKAAIIQNVPAGPSADEVEKARREYVLEVIAMGVTLDKYRQGKLWDALQQGSPYVTIREDDPNKYPWSANDKDGLGGKRVDDALRNSFAFTPMYWGVPSFFATSPDPKWSNPSPDDPITGVVGGANLGFHLFVVAPWMLAERPDRLIEEIFSFFDTHPDVPYVLLTAEDSLGTRDMALPQDTPRKLRDGYYVTEMPDASAVFVLARRERVEPLRKFVWDDPDDDFLHEKLRWMYGTLEGELPQPGRKTPSRSAAEIGADPSHHMSMGPVRRTPSVSEWLEASAAFAKRHDVVNQGTLSNLAHHVDHPINRPPRGWKPTPWFPIPWTKEQLRTFDSLPSLGYIHRPTFVKMTDEHGKPLERRDARQQALLAGWRQALQNLPEAERGKAPARIIAGTGGNTEQTIALHHVLNDHAAHGGHEIDSGKSTQYIDTDHRLGNTGAATFFVQMAIGVMGSYIDGGVSAAVNLRDRGEASIIFISPPSDEKRQAQAERDVFQHRATQAIDPANYQDPVIPAVTAPSH
ncbi:DUF2875 family protein [Rugamonas sp. CCM 8940]|uniref:type VI lipase adapter Tla3 domain-containing protein n=2 Tax=Rugamonas sp. CCM 8940 TaxID=2765359 RepID=UPI003614C13F